MKFSQTIRHSRANVSIEASHGSIVFIYLLTSSTNCVHLLTTFCFYAFLFFLVCVSLFAFKICDPASLLQFLNQSSMHLWKYVIVDGNSTININKRVPTARFYKENSLLTSTRKKLCICWYKLQADAKRNSHNNCRLIVTNSSKFYYRSHFGSSY